MTFRLSPEEIAAEIAEKIEDDVRDSNGFVPHRWQRAVSNLRERLVRLIERERGMRL